MTITDVLAWEKAATDGSRDAAANREAKPPKKCPEREDGYMTGYRRTRAAMLLRLEARAGELDN